MTTKAEAGRSVKDIRRATREIHSAEETIRIVLAGLRGKDGITEPCGREGTTQSLSYSWSKECFVVIAHQAYGCNCHKV